MRYVMLLAYKSKYKSCRASISLQVLLSHIRDKNAILLSKLFILTRKICIRQVDMHKRASARYVVSAV